MRKQYKNSTDDKTKCKHCERDLLMKEMHNGKITCKRCTFLRSRYNMTGRDYMFILSKQNGVCAICKNKELRPKKGTIVGMELSVDHCHTTGRVRGLLCQACNMGIGFLQDNEEYLWSAIMYLKNSPNLVIKPARKEKQQQKPKECKKKRGRPRVKHMTPKEVRMANW